MNNPRDINKLKKIIIDIFEMVEYYRTEGNPEKLNYNLDNFNINKNIKEIYETIDFFENYILNYNLYLYDIMTQEVFMKLLKTKKINGIDIILENKLEEIKRKYNNIQIISRVQYIVDNSYKINSINRLKELIDILKTLKVSDIQELENLFFILNKLNLIKKNSYTIGDIHEILEFIDNFKLSNRGKLKDEIKEMMVDKKNIDYLTKKYKHTIINIKQNKYLDKIIDYIDSLKN